MICNCGDGPGQICGCDRRFDLKPQELIMGTKDEQPKGKEVPLPKDEPGGLSGPAPLPKR